MILDLVLGKLKAFVVFLILAVGFRIGIVASGLAAVLLATSRIELTVSIGSAVAVAVVAVLTKGAADNPGACMAGNFLSDVVHSRFWTFTYRVFGGVYPFADTAERLAPISKPSVKRRIHVVRTAKLTGERFAAVTPLLLSKGVPPGGEPTVALDPSVKFQTMLGFGGSFTESSASVFHNLNSEHKQLVLDAYFDEEKGLAFKLGRFHIGSCDFSEGNWSCAEEPGDENLESFTIERYQQKILPMMRRAQEVAKSPILLMASPWSPPRWMKDTGSMLNGGKLLPQYREVWAKHYVKFAKAFADEGMPLWALSVQNEPLASTPWENCLYGHDEERDFVRDYLGPALRESGSDVKLLVWDHNRDDMFMRAKTIYSDPKAAEFVWGVAYHWYGDPRYEMWPSREGQVVYDNLRRVHELRPDKHIIMSEACQEFGPRLGDWKVGERYGEAIIRDFNNFLEAWIDWNLLLDETGGPNHVKNLVTAPVVVDVARNKVLFHTHFYYLGHFSRFIKPGAKRILASTNRDGLEATAFMNPDGGAVAVVMNQGDYDVSFWMEIEGEVAKTEAPAHSISTFIFADGDAPDGDGS